MVRLFATALQQRCHVASQCLSRQASHARPQRPFPSRSLRRHLGGGDLGLPVFRAGNSHRVRRAPDGRAEERQTKAGGAAVVPDQESQQGGSRAEKRLVVVGSAPAVTVTVTALPVTEPCVPAWPWAHRCGEKAIAPTTTTSVTHCDRSKLKLGTPPHKKQGCNRCGCASSNSASRGRMGFGDLLLPRVLLTRRQRALHTADQ